MWDWDILENSLYYNTKAICEGGQASSNTLRSVRTESYYLRELIGSKSQSEFNIESSLCVTIIHLTGGVSCENKQVKGLIGVRGLEYHVRTMCGRVCWLVSSTGLAHQTSDIKWYLLIKIWRYNIITLGSGGREGCTALQTKYWEISICY